MGKSALLKIESLSVTFDRYDKGLRRRQLQVISDLNVTVNGGEIVAVVGASGSGKSLLAHAVLGLLPQNATVRGHITFAGRELTAEGIKELRGRDIALVPQSVTYLDPLLPVGVQTRHGKKDDAVVARQRDLYRTYALKDDAEKRYPFELSGGMARRVLLTSALLEKPKLIIADEPTPGLDLPLAKKAMADFRAFADDGGGVLLITHDIELALEVADRVAVFYAGATVEEAPVRDFQSEATLRHPYTKALYRAFPAKGFQPLAGTQPYVGDMPAGCPFAPRCHRADAACGGEIPVVEIGGGSVRCVHPDLGEKEVTADAT